jgi:TolB protein
MRDQIVEGTSAWRRRLIAGAALGGALLLGLGAGQSSEAAYPGKLGKIVFKRSNPCCDLWLVDTKGNERQITFNGYSQGDPSWSADGKLITFRSRPDGNHGDIAVMNADGSGQHTITSDGNTINDDEPNFLPSGKKIVFQSDRSPEGDWDIYVMNAADGSGITPLTTTGAGISEFEPAVSPNGKLIAFHRDAAGEDGIWVMSVTGKNPRPVADLDMVFEAEPNFSPDGKLIAFNRTEAMADGEIWVTGVDGQGARAVTENDVFDDSPSFSPDGKTLVFDSSVTSMTNDQIVTIPLEGGTAHGLTSVADESQTPDWGPIPVRCGGKRSTIIGTPGKDKLYGTPDADVIAGLGGRDTLIGKGGNDRLCGGKGSDVLIGKGGRDRLIGGGKRDRCVGNAGRDRAAGCERQATI